MNETHPPRLMLISNSRMPGRGFLEHCAPAMTEFLGDALDVLFLPYAQSDWDAATAKVVEAFAGTGIEVIGVTRDRPRPPARPYDAIFIGGGNTFRLLATMQELNLLGLVREKVWSGIPYIGSSAGANLACPTICTTNDMPIIFPQWGFVGLKLVKFQLNPHFVDAPLVKVHGGETREERIAEFQAMRHTSICPDYSYPVVGLREGAWIIVENGEARLGGQNGAKIFPVDPDHQIEEWGESRRQFSHYTPAS